MKLNNKGFAISSIMYIILILAVVLIALTLAILSSRKLILDKLKNEVTNNIYEGYPMTYRQTLNILKEEAIAYASSNNIEKDSVKISNFETSIDENTITGYKLNDRYLTMVSNNDTYDVYLGEEETIKNTTELPKKTIDIIDYKIYGNSVQDGKPTPDTPIEIESVGDKTKNLFDISKFKEVMGNFMGEDVVIDGVKSNSFEANNAWNSYMPVNCKENTQYTLSYKVYKTSGEATMKFRYSDGSVYNININANANNEWVDVKATTVVGKTLTDIGGNGSTAVKGLYLANIQLEEGTNATEYEPYGKYKIPVTVRGKNLFNKDNVKYVGDNYINDSGVETTYIGTAYTNMKIKVEPNNIYTLSGLQTEDNYIVGVYYFDKEKNFISRYTIRSANYFTFTTPNNCEYVDFQFRTTNNDFTVWQLEHSDNKTIYEPYVEPIKTNIYLNEPLRKIGDYADYIDFENKKVVRKIYNDFITKVDSISVNAGKYRIFLTSINNKPLIEGSNGDTSIGFAYSNKFLQHKSYYPNLINNGGYIQSYITTSGANRIAYSFNDVSITTKEQAQKKIGDGFEVNYVLATPIEETIELPNIPTLKGTTILEVDTEILPSNMEFTVIKELDQL